MEQKIYDIAKKFNKMDYWGDTPVDQIPVWEAREILSFDGNHNLEMISYEFAKSENELIHQIVTSTIKNIPYTWDSTKLSIIGEAKIQYLLRANGYELKCFELNKFPTASTELAKYLESKSIMLKLRTRGVPVINSTIRTANSIFKWLAFFPNYVVYGTYIGIIYSLITAPWELFPLALLVGWILTNCWAMVIHEYWVHDLIVPRNRILGFILDYIGYILWGDRVDWRYKHLDHHMIWKTNVDPYIFWKDFPKWYIALTNLPTWGESAKKLSESAEWIEYRKKYEETFNSWYPTYLRSLHPESQFLERHHNMIIFATHIGFFVAFGVISYVYFLILQCFLFRRYILVFNEIVTHYNDLTREQESDQKHWFFVCCGTAYHTTHHYNPRMLVLGPSWIKYINIQYYFIKLFYKLAPGAKLS
jgi:hypothetical protein